MGKRSSRAKRKAPVRRPVPTQKSGSSTRPKGGDLEQRLIKGWPVAEGVSIREAGTQDLGSIRVLAARAGIDLGDVDEAIRVGACGAALHAVLLSGREAMAKHLAEQFLAERFRDQTAPYLHTNLVLLAEHETAGIVGVLLAGPPVAMVLEFLRHAKETGVSAYRRQQQLMGTPMALAQIRTVYVEPDNRGQGIGTGLLQRCREVYEACGFMILYGNASVEDAPDIMFRRAGFSTLAPGDGFDPWVIFGISMGILPNPGKRMFLWPADTPVVSAAARAEPIEADTGVPDAVGRGDVRAMVQTALASMSTLPAAWAPHAAALALWHLHADDAASNFDAAVIVADALNMLDVPAEPVPVVVSVKRPATESRTMPPSLGAHQPAFHGEKYTGYLVVYLPAVHAFIDVTGPIHDFSLPLEPLPAPDGLTRQPIKVERGQHEVGYFPIERRYRRSWATTAVPAAQVRRQRAATVLASHIIEVLRWDLDARPIDGRYALLSYILRRVRHSPLVVTDPAGCYFRLADRVEMSVPELRHAFAGT
jgi:GNAT superfamily N-acetyltransferase